MIGNVGINNSNPQVALDVTGYIRQNKLSLGGGGGNGWSSLTYNNVHNDANTDWMWPDLTHPSVTLEMDDGAGGGRFEVWTSPKNAQAYSRRFAIDGGTGFVGIGTDWNKNPDRPLTIKAQGTADELISFQNGAGDVKWHINQKFGGNPGLNFAETGVLDGRLFLKAGGNVGIGTTSPGFAIDVVGRGRLRQNAAGTAGMWYWQTNGGDRAFAGMSDDTHWGIWGVTKNAWVNKTDVTNGDVTIVGRLGTGGWPPTPHDSGWGGGLHTWDVEAEGTVWSRQSVQTGAKDLAENYRSDVALEPGDVICLDGTGKKILRTEKRNDRMMLGVISRQPGFLLGESHEPDKDPEFPVVLSGRTPCKVVDENGTIRIGDFLTSSSTPGHAMKAEPVMIEGRTFFEPGTILGKALEGHESGTGVIEMFACLS